MARFKIGDQIVCIKLEPWRKVNDKSIVTDTDMPKFNELVTVAGYKMDRHIWLVEYPYHQKYGRMSFHDKNFEPLITTQELNEALKSEEVTV